MRGLQGRSATTVCVVLLAVMSLASSSAWAVTLVVDQSGANGQFTNVQTAIDRAQDGDTVLVHPADYTLAEPLSFNRLHDPDDPTSQPLKNITLRAVLGPAETTIRAEIDFSKGESRGSVIEGFTITTTARVAIKINSGSSPTFRNCSIVDTGGVRLSHDTAIQCRDSAPELIDCQITGHGANAVHCSGASPIFTRCVLADNGGSGMVASGESNPVFTDC